jgi:hypothetical protein
MRIRRSAAQQGFGFRRNRLLVNEHLKWMIDRAFVLVTAQGLVAQWLSSFQEFPPRQKPSSLNLDIVMDKLTAPESAA